MTRRNQGFTLVEILVVIAIIAILMILGGANYTNQIRRSRDARRRSDLEQIRAALEMFRSEGNQYPNNLNDLVPTQINTLPQDPLDSSNYVYHPAMGFQRYELCATLETENPGTCGGGGGNFGITFP